MQDGENVTGIVQLTFLKMEETIAISQMSSEVKKFLSENFGDIKEWISNTIESVIYDLKNKFAGEKTDEKA